MIAKLEKDSNLNFLRSFLRSNIKNLNEIALIESLVFLRKLKFANVFQNFFTKDEEEILVLTLNEKIMKNLLNPNLVAQVFHEYALLKFDIETPYNSLQESLNNIKLVENLTPFALTLIISGLSLINRDKRKFADFGYKICSLLEKWVESITIKNACGLFNNICSLKLHFVSSHKKKVQILDLLIIKIEKNKESLNEEDFLNIIQGYINAPNTLGNSLLKYVKNTTLFTLSEKPLNLSSDFLIKFIEYLSYMKNGYLLNPLSLEFIVEEIQNRSEKTKPLKLNQISSLLIGLSNTAFSNSNIYNFLYDSVIKTPSKEYTLSLITSILILFVKQGYNVDKLIDISLKKFENEFSQRNPEILLKLLYILTFPNITQTEYIKIIRSKILKIITMKMDLNLKNNIISFGYNYSSIKSEEFGEIRKEFLTRISKVWNNLNINDKTTIAFGFINSKTYDKDWELFLKEKFTNLSCNDLNKFLSIYEQIENKNTNLVEFILDVILQSPEKERIIQKVLDAIIDTPPAAFQTSRGNTTKKLNKMIISINYDTLDLQIDLNYLLKIFCFLNLLKENHILTTKLTSIYLKNLQSSLQLQEKSLIYLSELGEFLIELIQFSDEGNEKNQIIAFILFTQNSLSKKLEQPEDIQNISLSLLIKSFKIQKFCREENIIKEDDLFLKFLVQEVMI